MSHAEFATLLDAPERRFPIETDRHAPRIGDLYRASLNTQWNPATDIDWSEVDVADIDPRQLVGARLRWSRSAWGEYGAISESPALQLRFYHERLEPEIWQFFAMRTQEEARHAEVCYRYAECLGGYYAEPPSGELAEYLAPAGAQAKTSPAAIAPAPAMPADRATTLYSHGVRRMALDPRFTTESIIAGLVCASEEVTFDQFIHMIEITPDPVAKHVLTLIARDETRHVAFGWRYIESRLDRLDKAGIDSIREGLETFIEEVELKGHHHPWLRPDTPTSRAEMEAFRLTHEAGLGASIEELEKPVFVDTIARIRRRVKNWGITLRSFHHPRLGAV